MKIKDAIYLLLKRKPKLTFYRLTELETLNGTWEAPEDGFLRMSIASDGTANGSYAYIRDVESAIDVLDIAVDGSSGYRRTNSVPVTKGRTYKLTHKSGLSDFVVVFYPLRGGINPLVSMLSALLEGWWKHENKRYALCDLAEGWKLQKPDNNGKHYNHNKQGKSLKPNSNRTECNWIYISLLDDNCNRGMDRYGLFRESCQFNNKDMGKFRDAIGQWLCKLPSLVHKRHLVVTVRGCAA